MWHLRTYTHTVHPAFVLIFHQNKIVFWLFTGDFQTNEHGSRLIASYKTQGKGLKGCIWKHGDTHTHTGVHLAHCSLHLFKQSENKRGQMASDLAHVKNQKESSWAQTILLPSTAREAPLTKISKGKKNAPEKKKICICTIFIYRKNLQILNICRRQHEQWFRI